MTGWRGLGRGERLLAANLASLNEIMTELVQEAVSRGWTDQPFADLAREVLRSHSWSLGYSFQGQDPAPGTPGRLPVPLAVNPQPRGGTS